MKKFLSTLFVLSVATSVNAQTNPCGTSTAIVPITATSVLCFEPSPDHNVTLPGLNNQPVVTEYAWEVYLKGATAPFWTTSLGKPTPAADGAIRVPPPPVPGMARYQEHFSRVVAVGPTGSGRSTDSNGFFLAPVPIAPGRPVIGQ